MKNKSTFGAMIMCIALGISQFAKAQIYSSEECYYAKSGNSSVSYVVRFEYSTDRVWIKSVNHSSVRNNLAKNEDFYIDATWTDHKDGVLMYQYDSQKSTSSREVYNREIREAIYAQCPNCIWTYQQGCGAHGYRTTGYEYVAFSTDKSSYILWKEKNGNYNGNVSKTYYSRVPKEELMPKAINYDFLND